MCPQMYAYLLILIALSRPSCAQREMKITASCPEHQQAFGGSCYEFVDLLHTFISAQAWCEYGGGHLAFIQDKETHYFLQRHLDPTKDTWFGAASSTDTLQYAPPVEGPLRWLDGSRITYSSWASSPQLGAACGHILRDSGLQWEATGDCNKTLPFICQFEAGKSIACTGHDTTLQCGSGQVLVIDGAVYGRQNVHYCRSTRSPPATPVHLECSWVDVGESLRAHCRGRRVCQITEVADSFGEPCPQMGSYLSLDYHCEDGLTLSVNAVAAVLDEVTIRVKGLSDDINCRLSTGDGRVIYLHSVERLESSTVHEYIHAGTFVVSVECTGGDMHITAQRLIAIQEPVSVFGVITCHAGKLSFHSSNCKALYGHPFQIQMEVKAGTNVTYRIQSDETLLVGVSVIGGSVPQSITVAPEMMKQLGPGCHQLNLYASNMVTFPEVSADLQMCVLEKVAGLRASVLTERDDCLDSPEIVVSVSLEQGAPVMLHFSLSGVNSSFSEKREMNTRKDIFHIRHQIQGSVQMRLTAWNVFSSSEVSVDIFASCGKDSVVESRMRRVRVSRSGSVKIEASPSASATTKNQPITLSLNKELSDSSKKYQWSCKNPCQCQTVSLGLTHIIQAACLPDPLHFNKYYFEVIKISDNEVEVSKSICVTLIPADAPDDISLTCLEGCDPITENTGAKLKVQCTGQSCQNHVWYIEDIRLRTQWDEETKSCYEKAGKKPLVQQQNSGDEYTVSYSKLSEAKSAGQDVTVVVVFDDTTPYYKTYVIKTSSMGNTAPQTTPGSSPTKATSASSGGPASNSDGLKCSMSPQDGTVFKPFTITCNTESPCSNCEYCFKTKEGEHLRCSKKTEVKCVFLPVGDSSSNYKLVIEATAKNKTVGVSTTITTRVRDSTTGSNTSVESLKAAVEGAVAELKKENLLTGESVAQLFSSVSNKLNQQSNESNKEELRELMLEVMIAAVNQGPPSTPAEVQAIARGVNAIVQKGSELSSSTQASFIFENLSSSLLHMEGSSSAEVQSAGSTIVEGAGNLLGSSSNKNISETLLVTLNNIQSALLMSKNTNEGSTVILKAGIGLLVNRVAPKSLHTESVNIPNLSCPKFSLPVLPSNVFPSEESVDVRVMSLDPNPFSWNGRGNISSQIASLSLTTKNGSSIPVEDLSEDIEILLPNPLSEQANVSVLDLGNYSTMAIDISSADITLVLKMVPSTDPLPFKLFLGYMDYPTDTNYIAMTEMPQQGTTQEEKYAWILEPKDLKGNTGVHYLLVRPIVGPGIKSIDANLSISPITTACKFWNESILDWSDNGCRVGVQTTRLVTQCLCNHLTFFGSSFFVTPNTVDASRTAELFATFGENPVVVCFVGALFIAYFLVVVWARRKDVQDTAKVKVTVLDDNDPVDEYRYLLSVSTGHRRGASTSSQVTITLLGTEGNSEPHHLTDPKKPMFERGAVDLFLLTTPFSLGDLQAIRLWHNNSGSHPDWYVGNVMVQDLQTEQKWHFLCNSWLAIDIGDCSLDKVCPVSSEMDLKRFSNLFFMKTSKDFSDGHLWYSVISRPPSSTFTCVQRVSCCFSLLLCTMLTSIMFYGIPVDPSEQTMDLGHFEFTWQQFMIGVQSSLIMFPINILIVSIFRNTRPRETSCCRRKTQKPATPVPQTTDKYDVTLETVIKEITRIVNTLSKTVKSNTPCTYPETEPGKQADINAILSVVEDFIKQSYKTSDTAQSKTPSIQNLAEPQTPEDSAGTHPGSTVEGIQKKSNKTQFLYQQLCHIDKELSLLGPSSFPTPQSYSQALQQVQGMKGLLEDQLFKFSSDPDEPTQKKLSPADSSGDGDSSRKKRVCCHGGFPWWFVFLGWLLVIGTSVVSGYYTMLYGLKFGKDRSINWLVSMIVSFFQSILVIQPLKVLCLAVFFALIIKKVDDDDYQNMALAGSDRNLGERQMVRHDSSLYEPPPTADIEKMRRNKILEQKAFALFREILIYMGFMWMLLLVAYGQKDPNAYFLNQHIRTSFGGQISSSMSLGDVFTWANTSLLNNLFGVYPGFITDGNSKLVGNARIRQLRVQKKSCQIAGSLHQFVPDCHALYSWEVEDMGSYDPGWNRSVGDNISTSSSSPWRYQTQSQLRAYPVWGMALYRGGGFVADLGPDSENASSTLEYLFRNKWLDVYTRAIFVEFTVYNANVNLFCIVRLMFETMAVGAFQFSCDLQSIRLYQSTGGLHVFVLAAEIIYLLFILYYMFVQGKLMKRQRWAYFKNKWNLLELTIILLTWSAVGVFTKRTLVGIRDITYYQNHKDQFASFYETATADLVLQYLVAFLVLLSTVKLWHLLRLNPKMNMITATLQRAWSDISSFLVVIVLLLVAYSIASNVIYGWKMSSYRTLVHALMTVIKLQIGIFNYEEVLDCTPLLGGLLFGSCIVFMTFVLLNLLISVILVAFNQEQLYHKPSDEEEVVDLMLKKICSLFGIRYQNTKDTHGPEANEGSGLTLNNSSNIHSHSSTDVNTFQTAEHSGKP